MQTLPMASLGKASVNCSKEPSKDLLISRWAPPLGSLEGLFFRCKRSIFFYSCSFLYSSSEHLPPLDSYALNDVVSTTIFAFLTHDVFHDILIEYG
jgi:hypothetical protein